MQENVMQGIFLSEGSTWRNVFCEQRFKVEKTSRINSCDKKLRNLTGLDKIGLHDEALKFDPADFLSLLLIGMPI